MRIMFLNVWNFRQTSALTQFLTEQISMTDVFCFQEAYEKTRFICTDLLKDFIGLFDYKYILDTTDSYADEFPQATYVKTGVEVTRQTSVLKNVEGVGLALHTQLQCNNKTIHICNVHGISKPGNKLDDKYRLQQSSKLIEYFKDLEGIKIIGGDFNLEIQTESVKLFAQAGYVDLIEKYNIKTTRNRLVWEKYPNSILYYSDFVFVSPDCKVESFEVPNIEVSDHLPIILTMRTD